MAGATALLGCGTATPVTATLLGADGSTISPTGAGGGGAAEAGTLVDDAGIPLGGSLGAACSAGELCRAGLICGSDAKCALGHSLPAGPNACSTEIAPMGMRAFG